MITEIWSILQHDFDNILIAEMPVIPLSLSKFFVFFAGYLASGIPFLEDGKGCFVLVVFFLFARFHDKVYHDSNKSDKEESSERIIARNNGVSPPSVVYFNYTHFDYAQYKQDGLHIRNRENGKILMADGWVIHGFFLHAFLVFGRLL